MDCDFNPLGDKIVADALSRSCSTCDAAVCEPCAGLDGQAFHAARALMARDLLAIAETYVEWHRDIPPPEPPPPLPDEPDDRTGVVLLIVFGVAVVLGAAWLIYSGISGG